MFNHHTISQIFLKNRLNVYDLDKKYCHVYFLQKRLLRKLKTASQLSLFVVKCYFHHRYEKSTSTYHFSDLELIASLNVDKYLPGN